MTVKQRGVEERHGRPDLVERCRADDAQVGGPPQQRDLLAQPAPRLAVLRRREPGIVESREEDGAASERDERRPASRLGRVGGEDGPDRQPTDEGIELGIRPAEPAQPGHRIRHRIVEDAVARRALAPAQGADATTRLGQVDQPEIERERPDHGLGGAEV